MAEVKNSFLKSKMNQDLDDRLIPNGEYRYANNISVGKSETDDIGTLKNVLGNELLPLTDNNRFIEGTDIPNPNYVRGLECIGIFMDNQNNRMFQFLTSYTDPNPNQITFPTTGTMKIVMYRFDSPETYATLVEGLFLNFAKNKQFKITGVNLVEDLLFWTDNRNQPRKINITNALNNTNYYTTEEQISVAKYAPVDPITLYKKEIASVVSGTGDTYVLSNMDSLACTIGAVSGTSPNPYTATITTAVADGFAGFSVGDVIAGNNGTGSFGLGQLVITSLINSTSVKVSSTSVFSTGTVSITLRYPYLGAIQSGATVLSVDPSGSQFLNGSDYALVESISNTTLKLYQTTDKIGDDYILTFLISTMTDKSSIPSWPGDPAFLEDKYVRFSYRFKYDDNEYSLMAPFTQIAYVPKQKGYFIAGDETDAYRSTVINWFENNINNIELIIPFPDKIGNLTNSYKITEVDILYKESDSNAIKVFETVPISAINISANTENNYYIQQYQSQKPYKTLSEDQTVRVYDKVPVRARAQESAGNRIIYGNYYDKYTSLDFINYNISVQPKSNTGTNFIEYPNHTLKKNRNYQVGFIIADKFGRQSPVILSSGDLPGLSIGGGEFAKGSTVYSSYENTLLFTDVRSWFGDALILYLNSTIDQQKDIPAGKPGLYAIPTNNSGFSITASAITNTTYTYTLDTTAALNTTPVAGNIMRGFYKDYVKVLTNPVPTLNPNEYIVTTDGRVNDIYLHVAQVGGVKDIKFSYIYNPIGWYSYKVVVKQQEQDYYNVYLPGMLNGYPQNQTFGSQVTYTDPTAAFSNATSATWAAGNSTITILGSTTNYKVGDFVSGIISGANTTIATIINANSFTISNTPATSGTLQAITVFRASEGQTSVLNNGINTTQFPVSETGNTSHIVLINDNINKVPRDLSEVGPDQKQYRSSVQLYGRVENTKTTVGIQGNVPLYSAKVTTIEYDADTNPDYVLIKPGDGIQCTEANAPVPNPDPALGGTVPNPYRWLGNTVVVSNEVNGATSVITISSPNWVLEASANPNGDDFRNFIITRAENVQYFPTRKADTVISIAYADEFNFIDSSEDNLSGTAGLNFYQLQTKPLIGRVSTVNSIGVVANEMIPFLSVYETRAENSLLELFWETATTGLISDLNADVLTGFDGATSFGEVNYEHFEWQKWDGAGNVAGAENSRYITDAFYVLNQNGIILPNASVALTNVTDGNGAVRLSDFGLESITGGIDNLYRLFITETSTFVFNNNAASQESYTFTFNVIDMDNPAATAVLTFNGRLGNIAPNITTSILNYNITPNTTNIVTLQANNGSESLSIEGLKWSIYSGNTGGIFTLDPVSGLLTLNTTTPPLGNYSLDIKVQDAINTSTGEVLDSVNPIYGTLEDTITLNINIGVPPAPFWLRPDFVSAPVQNPFVPCGGLTPDLFGMAYIGKKIDPTSAYLPVVPGSAGNYEFIYNIEQANAIPYEPSGIIPEGLYEGEYRFKVKLDVTAIDLCGLEEGFVNATGRAEIYLYKREYANPPTEPWQLVNNENNFGITPVYEIGPLVVRTSYDPEVDPNVVYGQPKSLTTSFTIAAEDEEQEYAVGVKLIYSNGGSGSGTSPAVTIYGNDANYSYVQTLPGFQIPLTNDYKYYTGVEEYVGFGMVGPTTGVPYTTPNAVDGIYYSSLFNTIASGDVVVAQELVEVTLSVVNNQAVAGLSAEITEPGGSLLAFGNVVYVNPLNPAEITIQLNSGWPWPLITSLAGKNLRLVTGGNSLTGVLYANTEEGTEIKRFYTDEALTTKWIPPVAGRYYNFITEKDYNPLDSTFGGLYPGVLKYSKFPYYCARINENGEVMEQVAPQPNVQTAWEGQNTANTAPKPIQNYSYNVLYVEPPIP
jgi:hypothetical protein